MRSWFKPGAVEVPVPPLAMLSIPESALIEGEVVEVMRPFVAWRKPFKDEARVVAPDTFRVPVITPLPFTCKPVDEAVPTTSNFVFGLIVPMPTFPAPVIYMDCVKAVPLLVVRNARSPVGAPEVCPLLTAEICATMFPGEFLNTNDSKFPTVLFWFTIAKFTPL